MAAYLMRWLNSSCPDLTESITSLETQLSNGYIIAKLLHRYKLINPEEFKDFLVSNDFEAKVYNFKLLDALLGKSGVKYNPKIIGQIINEERGAAAKLLFLIKCKVQPDIAPKLKTLNPSDKNSHEEYVEIAEKRKPQISKSLDQALRGQLTRKQLKQVLRQTQFDKVRIQNEEKCEELQTQEIQEIKRLRSEIRQERLENFRQGRRFFEEWMEESQKSWQQQQNKFIEMERRDLIFELTLREQQRVKIHNERVDHTNDMRSSIHAFERNLKRVGIDVDDNSPCTLVQNAENTHNESSLSLRERIEKALLVTKAEVNTYMKRIKQDREESSRARKEREQRRRKIYIDQKQAQTAAADAHKMKLLLESIDKEAKEERIKADILRRKRHHRRKKKTAAQMFARRSILQRDIYFRKQVVIDNEMLKKQRTEYLNSREYETISEFRNVVANKKRQRKRDKAIEVCSNSLNLIIEAAMIVSEQRPMSISLWKSYKCRIIEGSFENKYSDNQNTVNTVQTNGKGNSELDDEFKSLQNHSGVWSIDHFGNPVAEQHSMKRIKNVIATLSKNPESIPSVQSKSSGLKICIIGPPGSGKTSVAVRLKHRLGIQIIEPVQLLEKANRFYEETHPGNEISTNSEGELDEFAQSLHNLGEILQGADPETIKNKIMDSIELAKVVSLHMVSAGNEWIVDGFPRNQQQAQMLEYTLSLHEPKTASDIVPKQDFNDFCKIQDKIDPSNRMFSPTCVFQVALHRYWDSSNNFENKYKEWQDSNVWLETWCRDKLIKLDGIKVKKCEEDNLTSEAETDSNDLIRQPDDEVLHTDIKRGRDTLLNQVLSSVQDITKLPIPLCTDKGIELYRKHLEAVDPYGSGEPVNLEKARELNQLSCEISAKYELSCKAALQKMSESFQEAEKESNEIIQAGTSLILGHKTSEITDISKVEAILDNHWINTIMKDLNSFNQKYHQKNNRLMKEYEEEIGAEKLTLVSEAKQWIQYTENTLFDYIVRNGKLAQSTINEWKSKNTAIQLVDGLVLSFLKLIDAEQTHYTKNRELIKEYFASIEQSVPVDKTELLPSVKNKLREAFIGKTKTEKELTSRLMRAKTMVELRRARGENDMNPCPDSLGKALIELNEKFYFRICAIESVVVKKKMEILQKYCNCFVTLDGIQSKQMKREINRITNKAKEMRDILSVWESQS